MFSRVSGALACASVISVSILGLTACGGGSARSTSASDAASGLTVTVAGNHVTLKRTAKSASGTGGTSGTVSCTDDYAKLVKATAVPAPTQPWYATTLITWPAAAKQSSATFSHGLKNDPQLCIAQTADSSAQVIIYFNSKVKSGVQKLQTDSARNQQAAQASQALQAAAQAAVGAVNKNAFPDVATLVQAMTAQGLYTKQAAGTAQVTEPGTIYVLTSKTTKTKLVAAMKDSKGKVQTVTSGVKGSPKLGTA
jgi:hypothetical protein